MRFVVIGAVWCPSCLVMRPIYEIVFKEFEMIPNVHYDLDFDEEATKYNPGTKLPVLILEDETGLELLRIVGEQKINSIVEKLKEKVVNK